MDEMTSDFEAQRFVLMQAVSEQVILPSQLKALCPNKMMSDRQRPMGNVPLANLSIASFKVSHRATSEFKT